VDRPTSTFAPDSDLEPAMRRALELAATPTVPLGPNPRVGAVILDADGARVGEGFHAGAGSDHAEVAALRAAGERARGGTAVVTLEPCHHVGRTGPCSQALLDAGIARVVFAMPDGSPVAAGGATALRAAGVAVASGLLADEARALNPEWSFGLAHGRPFVTWKVAATLDGRIAAADGTSRWITGAAARQDVHALRAVVDAVVVGTGTVLADDPQLTVRDAATIGGHQPTRVVVGRRPVPDDARIRDHAAPTWFFEHASPGEVAARLWQRGCHHVLLESGPTLAAAFLSAECVDRVVTYVAPTLLGAGAPMVADLGINTLAEAIALRLTDLTCVGDDVRLSYAIDQPVIPTQEA
jgi:diaminohydroxyphosphoribosylaminopyrimidine deaminase/5-amino-6-(5-phosphoribosylamino)uracil reductase